MKINKPGNPNGNLLMHYKGKNIMMHKTSKGFTLQKAILKESVCLQNDEFERCCFEVTFYDKFFLLVIDGYKIYQIIIEEGGKKKYAKLTDTWIYADFFEENNLFVIKGQINYFNQVTPDFLIEEIFQFQANFINQPSIRDMFDGVNENN